MEGRYIMEIFKSRNSDDLQVIIADSNPLFRNGLINILKSYNPQTNFIELDNFEDTLNIMNLDNNNLLVLELSLANATGMSAIQKLRDKLNNPIFVIVFAGQDEFIFTQTALQYGVDGYLLKNECEETIASAISTVLNGEKYVSHAFSSRFLKPQNGIKESGLNNPVEILSNRELEVLWMTGEGKKPRVIASELNLSIRTVETYFGRIKQKLNLKNAAHLGEYSVKWIHGR